MNAPLRPVCPPMSTSALLVWLISMARSVLFWPVALTFTWRPPATRVVVTWTGGRGLHETGGRRVRRGGRHHADRPGVVVPVRSWCPSPGEKMPIITVYVPVAAPAGTFQVTG